MTTRDLAYKAGTLDCLGFLAEPDGVGPHPGVLVVHEVPGLGEPSRRRARMLADLGYVALAANIYGADAGVNPSPARMLALLDDRLLLRERALAALTALKALPNVDPGRIAAIGYCFGGTTVMELARAGTRLNGVISFHGGLKTSLPAEPGAIQTRMLICTGSADPTIPAQDREAAGAEFTRGGADWQMIVYGGAKHAFTNVDAPPIEGFGYDAVADRRSWAALQTFFGEVLT